MGVGYLTKKKEAAVMKKVKIGIRGDSGSFVLNGFKIYRLLFSSSN